jgi:hypothetical protein
MRLPVYVFTAMVAAALAIPGAAAAQKLATGKWTGTVTPPNEPATQVAYDVRTSGDTTFIKMTAVEHGSFDFSNIKVTGDTLYFEWSPGTQLKCTLTRRPDASYAGTCLDASGSPGQMTMTPPK